MAFCLTGTRLYAQQVGAITPFTTYEAENGQLAGGASAVSTTAPPTTAFSSPALEASGHSYVQLTGTGQSITWTNNTGKTITAINLRECIPDSSGGGGIASTINIYVNGTLNLALPVNSYQTWCYEGGPGGLGQIPSQGNPRVFWDEARAFLNGAGVPPGGTISVKMDPSNAASFYWIDCIDLEAPPTPLTQPANSLSITSYGAQANNANFDNTTSIQSCFNAAQTSGQTVWIPQGVFYVTSGQIMYAHNITISGAGPWYSTVFDSSSPTSWGVDTIFQTYNSSFSNLCIDCSGTGTQTPSGAGRSSFLAFGSGWTLNNIWSRHLENNWAEGNNFTVQNCRVFNSYFDSIHINPGYGNLQNITIKNNFVRAGGDDQIAISGDNILVQNNTCIAAWAGKGVGVYGGTNIVVQNNYIADSARYSGMGIGYFQLNQSILGCLVRNNVIERAGGNGFGSHQAAVDIGTSPAVNYVGWNLPVAVANNIVCVDNVIDNPVYDPVTIHTSGNLVFQGNTMNAPWYFAGIDIDPTAVGYGTLSDNILADSLQNGAFYDDYNPNYQVCTTSQPASLPIQAASYNSVSGSSIGLQSCSEGGQNLNSIQNGNYAVFNNVDLNGATTFVARVASAAYTGTSAGNVQVCLDSPTSTPIGTLAVSGTGGWQNWLTQTCNLSGGSGYHNVYLVFTGGSGALFNLEWFGFHHDQLYSTAAASYSSLSAGSVMRIEGCTEGGQDLCNIFNGNYAVYNNVNINSASAFTARVASAAAGGTINVCLDSPTATPVGSVTVPSTGGWQNWTTISCPIAGPINGGNNQAGGYHTVYLMFNGGGGSLFNVQWFNLQGVRTGTDAASYNSISGSQIGVQPCSEGGQNLQSIQNGYYAVYNNVALNNVTSFTARVASAGSGGTIKVCLDSPTATPVGTVTVPVTGGWQNWATVNCNLAGVSGYHNVYLVFSGGGGYLFNVESFAFQRGNLSTTQAAGYNSLSTTSMYLQSSSEGGQNLANIQNGYYAVYNNIDLNDATTFTARVSSAGSGGTIKVCLDSPTATPVGTLTVSGTSGWQNWATATCGLIGASGYHNVYLVFSGGSGALFNLAWFEFAGIFNPVSSGQASSLVGGCYLQGSNDVTSGVNIAGISNGNYAVFPSVYMTGTSTITARVASAGSGGNVNVCLGSPTATPIATMAVPVTGGWQTWTTVSTNLTSSATGWQTVYLVFTGSGGNLFNLEWFQFLPSGQAPINSALVTATNLSGSMNNSDGWFTGPTTVTLVPKDTSSTVTATHYSLDGGSVQGYSAPITVAGGGEHTVTYYSQDAAGFLEPNKTQVVRIDGTSPLTTEQLTGTGLDKPGLVLLAPTDDMSGVAATYYTVNGGAQQTYSSPFAVPYGQMLKYWSVDVAGNTENQNTLVIGGPYGGGSWAIPGVVEAANYDTGGLNIGYYANGTNGTANSYRADGDDLEVTSDSQNIAQTGGGYDIGWTNGGQWFNYTVNVGQAGTYTFSFRVAAQNAVSDAFHLQNSSGTNLTGSVNIPSTGGSQNWTTVTASVTLAAGIQTLTLIQDNAFWNYHWMSAAFN